MSSPTTAFDFAETKHVCHVLTEADAASAIRKADTRPQPTRRPANSGASWRNLRSADACALHARLQIPSADYESVRLAIRRLSALTAAAYRHERACVTLSDETWLDCLTVPRKARMIWVYRCLDLPD